MNDGRKNVDADPWRKKLEDAGRTQDTFERFLPEFQKALTSQKNKVFINSRH